MEFFLFLLYNQENSREKYFPSKERRNKYEGNQLANTVQTIHMMKSVDEYYCDVNLDEDEYYRFVSSDYRNVRIIVPEMNIRCTSSDVTQK